MLHHAAALRYQRRRRRSMLVDGTAVQAGGKAVGAQMRRLED